MKYIKILIIISAITSNAALYAGNPERQGTAGAQQLTMNGWGKSASWGGIYGACGKGLDASYINIAGLASSATTEVGFYRTEWLRGSGIGLNNFGFAQRLGADGDKGTMLISVMQVGIKPIMVTTESNPYGNGATYRVSMTNIGLGYAKNFGKNIHAGIVFKAVSEGIPDVRANGICMDAGVQYNATLNPKNIEVKGSDFHFGISMKNIGPDMRPNGDGLTYKALINGLSRNVQVKADKIKLPSFLNIAASYDMNLGSDDYANRLTWGFSFANYSFSGNQTTLGLEYGYKKFFSIRGGFTYQEGAFTSDNKTSAFTGLCGGISYNWQLGSNNRLALDYSYRHTNPFNGTHTFGLILSFGTEED